MSRITIRKDGRTARVSAVTAAQHLVRGWEIDRRDTRGSAAWERHCEQRHLVPYPEPKKTSPPKKASPKTTKRKAT